MGDTQDLLFTNSINSSPSLLNDEIDILNDKYISTYDQEDVNVKIDEQKQSDHTRRYQKHIITSVAIDSRDRNYSSFVKPNQYNIYLNREYENVVSISLTSTEVPNAIQPVNLSNNDIIWKTKDYIDFIDEFGLNLADYKPENFESVTTIYKASIPPGYYSTEGLAIKMSEIMNSTPSADGTAQFFNIFIDPDEHVSSIISRFEELRIDTVSIVQDSNILSITLEQPSYIDALWTDIRIIMTDIPNIGGIPPSVFNNIEIKDVLYENTNGGLLLITLPLKATYTQIINNLNDTKATIGRARYFNLIQLETGHDDFQNSEGTVNTILSVMGFPIPRANIVVIGEKIPYRAIHYNIDYLLDDYINVATLAGEQANFFNSSTHVLNIQIGNDGKYYFRSEPYVYLRLTIPYASSGDIGGNILASMSNSNNIESRNVYYENPFQKTLQLNNKLIAKDPTNIFAKIQLDPIPGNIHYNKFAKSHKMFYNIPLRRLGVISVEFIDFRGKLIDLRSEHAITIEITEKIDVLEDTLMNSRTGDTVTSGIHITKLKQ